ncbi:hypothetical protein FB45DRAFT_889821 [Roridomyces roridus]|uniref:Uncharacterized protein n=1 Tax=Roridomyces roridus TaxID=1738132 RepID=A0AAD7FZI8_9AGAR|nr:hypothetical protein FB45DRAFT_889821 [Roridomyces roridus]
MEPPSSPFRLSPGSTCSSSLIMTPAPVPPLPVRGPLAKGPLQPHITNLPRRHKATPPLRNIAIPAPSSSSASAESPSTYAQTPIQLPTLPFPISAGIPQRRVDASDEEEEDSAASVHPPSPPSPPAARPTPLPAVEGRGRAVRGPVQPSHGTVPRRARGLTEAQIRARRRRERCVQELGSASSGVFVAFTLDSEKEKEKEGEGDEEFGAVVRIVPAPSSSSQVQSHDDVDDKGGTVLRVISCGTRDDGIPSLKPGQLRDICSFVDKHRARRVVITAPRSHAVDALAAGVCAVYSVSREEAVANDGQLMCVEPKPLHRLVMRWHDLPSPDEDEDREDEGSRGLKDAWRGLLSRRGMDYIADALLVEGTAPTLELE